MTTKLPLGIVGFVLIAGTSASAADLVNRGGASDVPTYDGRKYYIKAAGASCPSGFTCFCNSGSLCTLPSSPATITGTVVIDRPGVTLDCQNRTIQAPRFSGSDQACSSSSDCGDHSSGSPDHVCVNGYCQLGQLGGINVGGPFGVDDGSININVNATGAIQDVQIRNCKVKNHYAGYMVHAFEGDDGLDDLEVNSSELRDNHIGLSMYATDASQVWGNNVHDNARTGLDFDYNWSLRVPSNTVHANGVRQIYVHGDFDRRNRWLDLGANFVTSTFTPPSGPDIGTVLVLDMEGTLDGQCDSEGELCDLYIEANDVVANNGEPQIELRRSYSNGVTVLLRGNALTNFHSVVDVLVHNFHDEPFFVNPVCWNKNNVCDNGGGTPVACLSAPPGLFSSGTTCWN